MQKGASKQQGKVLVQEHVPKVKVRHMSWGRGGREGGGTFELGGHSRSQLPRLAGWPPFQPCGRAISINAGSNAHMLKSQSATDGVTTHLPNK